jgi:cytochrome c553
MLRALIALAVVASVVTPAAAFPEFQKQFFAKYADGANAEFTALAKQAKCLICHQGMKSKKNRNAYGEALHEHLGKKDKKNVEKIVAALATVAGESSDSATEGAPTWGDVIATGKLPAGEIEDLKQEPAAE